MNNGFFSFLIMDQNQTTLLAAIIALSGVILSAVVSALVSRRSAYINAVTVERSKWIDKLRNNISECLGSLGYLHYKISLNDEHVISKAHDEIVEKNEVLMNRIKLQLNPLGTIDKNIIALLDKISFLAECDGDTYRRAEELLLRHSQWLLKEEWEKVKYEARGPTRYLWGWPKKISRSYQYRKFSDGPGSIALFDRNSQMKPQA